MAFLQRYLIARFAVLVATVFLANGPVHSAQNDGADTVFNTFCVNLDGYVSGIYYDCRGEKIEITASNVGLSSPYKAPPGGLVSLYRELPPIPPETKPRRVPVAEIRLGTGGPWLVVLSATPNPASPGQPSISASAINHSWEDHPVGMVRIFNFCPSRAAFQLAGQAFELAPGETRIVPLPKSELPQLLVKAAVKKEDQWQLHINRPQRILPLGATARLSWVLMEVPPDIENPEPRFLLRNLLEDAPVPPASNP